MVQPYEIVDNLGGQNFLEKCQLFLPVLPIGCKDPMTVLVDTGAGLNYVAKDLVNEIVTEAHNTFCSTYSHSERENLKPWAYVDAPSRGRFAIVTATKTTAVIDQSLYICAELPKLHSSGPLKINAPIPTTQYTEFCILPTGNHHAIVGLSWMKNVKLDIVTNNIIMSKPTEDNIPCCVIPLCKPIFQYSLSWKPSQPYWKIWNSVTFNNSTKFLEFNVSESPQQLTVNSENSAPLATHPKPKVKKLRTKHPKVNSQNLPLTTESTPNLVVQIGNDSSSSSTSIFLDDMTDDTLRDSFSTSTRNTTENTVTSPILSTSSQPSSSHNNDNNSSTVKPDSFGYTQCNWFEQKVWNKNIVMSKFSFDQELDTPEIDKIKLIQLVNESWLKMNSQRIMDSPGEVWPKLTQLEDIQPTKFRDNFGKISAGFKSDKWDTLQSVNQQHYAWKLNSGVFKRCCTDLKFRPSIDGLATFNNKQLKRYCSRRAEISNFATDTYTLPKKTLKAFSWWLHPNVDDIELTVKWIITHKVKCLLFVPKWENCNWYQNLIKLGHHISVKGEQGIFQDIQGNPLPKFKHDFICIKITPTNISKFMNTQNNREWVASLPSLPEPIKVKTRHQRKPTKLPTTPTTNLRQLTEELSLLEEHHSPYCSIEDVMQIRESYVEEINYINGAPDNRQWEIWNPDDDTPRDFFSAQDIIDLKKCESVYASEPVWKHNCVEYTYVLLNPKNCCDENGNFVTVNQEEISQVRQQNWDTVESAQFNQKMNGTQLTPQPDLCEEDPTVDFTHPQKCIEKVVKKHKNVFMPAKFDPKIKRAGGVSHKIELLDKNASPVRNKPMRMNPMEEKGLLALMEKFMKKGWVQRSNSEWASRAFVVPKKTTDKYGNQEWRLVIDFRRLNELTKKMAYPLPKIDVLLRKLHGKSVFSAIDFESGFHQLPMDPETRHLAAFVTPIGLFEYTVLPMGIASAPSTFQKTMDIVFKDVLLEGFSFVYLDDITIASHSWEEHAMHLDKVLTLISNNNLTLRLSKCQFGKTELSLLGHIVNEKGIQCDGKKLKALLEYPTPTTSKQVHRFVGLCGYYQEFIPGFQVIAKPLFNLLQEAGKSNKNLKFLNEEENDLNTNRKSKKIILWTQECDMAVKNLKKLLCEAPTLAYPDPNSPYTIWCVQCL